MTRPAPRRLRNGPQPGSRGWVEGVESRRPGRAGTVGTFCGHILGVAGVATLETSRAACQPRLALLHSPKQNSAATPRARPDWPLSIPPNTQFSATPRARPGGHKPIRVYACDRSSLWLKMSRKLIRIFGAEGAYELFSKTFHEVCRALLVLAAYTPLPRPTDPWADIKTRQKIK